MDPASGTGCSLTFWGCPTCVPLQSVCTHIHARLGYDLQRRGRGLGHGPQGSFSLCNPHLPRGGPSRPPAPGARIGCVLSKDLNSGFAVLSVMSAQIFLLLTEGILKDQERTDLLNY